MAEGLLGNLLGSVAKMILRMLLFGAILGMGALGAILGGLFLSVEAGFFLLILIVGIETFGCMFIAAGIFEKMEVNN